MAGIEHLEVHSKAYVVRWVKIDEGNTLSWSVQPNKKSLNFGIVKHPGSGATNILSTANEEPRDATQTHGNSGKAVRKETTAQDLLVNKGFIPIQWCGKYEADKVSLGSLEVSEGAGGMYGLVFDNTFSKTISKTATFVILTYPTGHTPQITSHLPNLQAPSGNPGLPDATISQDSLTTPVDNHRPRSASNRSDTGNSPNYRVGTLLKRRRKKGQGYARRYFSLDYSTCTFSYYYNRNSSALRGAIPLSLAAVAADEKRREITIDSGAEVWHLRAPNDKEFLEWARALERASRVARGLETLEKTVHNGGLALTTRNLPAQPTTAEDTTEWQQVEALLSRVVGTRDALRRLTKELANLPSSSSTASKERSVSGPSQFLTPTVPPDDEAEEYFTPAPEKKSFWRRKSQLPPMSPLTPTTTTGSGKLSKRSGRDGGGGGSEVGEEFYPRPSSSEIDVKKSRRRVSKSGNSGEESSVSDHCRALLADLDSVVEEFTSLIGSRKRRTIPPPASNGGDSRLSMETASTTDEFFDANDAGSNMIKIDGSDDETAGGHGDGDEDSLHETSSSVSSVGEEDPTGLDGGGHLYPQKPKSLAPISETTVTRRRMTIPQATVPPPSLIAFVRKNVGKDLSTISMPVSANEPTSLLQKVAEQLEYSDLLDTAAKEKNVLDRLMYVAAFAVSQFSSGRTKERAIRKPFNPLLGETFELIRGSDEVPGGLRLLVEKVQHRPVKLAMHADSAHWSFTQSPAPAQKFWGKSAEITTDGRVRVALRLKSGADELYSWNIATMFLRNVVMGEKYVEPVGSMTVVNDSTGHKAGISFKSKGMFGGRAEDVHVEILDPNGQNTETGLTGTWTNGLRPVMSGKPSGQEIWKVGQLVEYAAQTYGMTRFAATLNEITAVEKGKLPPTDTRLRPDQRLAEEGQLEEAENWKVMLEEAQRGRRKQLEDAGAVYQPRWFVRAENAPEGEEVWKMRGGKDGYWEERSKGKWTGVTHIFEVQQ